MAILQPPVKLEATDGYGGDVAKESQCRVAGWVHESHFEGWKLFGNPKGLKMIWIFSPKVVCKLVNALEWFRWFIGRFQQHRWKWWRVSTVGSLWWASLVNSTAVGVSYSQPKRMIGLGTKWADISVWKQIKLGMLLWFESTCTEVFQAFFCDTLAHYKSINPFTGNSN